MSDIHDAIDRFKAAVDQAAFDLKSSIDAINFVDEIEELRNWLAMQQRRIQKKIFVDKPKDLS